MPRSRSEPGVDAYRAVVVVAMFVVHARRLQLVRGSGPLERALDACMWAEPFIAASFLFIAGFVLVLSHDRAPSGWLPKLLRRALGLYALSILLFVPQYGVELPDLLTSSGILSAIALALALTGALLSSSAPEPALGATTLLVLAVTFWLDRSGRTISGLNGGPGGAFPLVAFSTLGALLSRARRRFGARALFASSALALLLTGAVIASGVPWTTLEASLYHQHAGALALGDLFRATPLTRVVFWNHSALGALGLTFPLLASLGACLALGPALARLRAAQPVLLLGRHALVAYVLHLGLLGVTDLVGLDPPNERWTWCLIGALTAAALATAAARERWPHLAPAPLVARWTTRNRTGQRDPSAASGSNE